MVKQIICLSFAAIVGFASAVSAGTYNGGNGWEADPYQISTPANMQAIGANPADWDKHFVLTNNIDLSGYTGTQFNIIGRFEGWGDPNTKLFTGVFDGNGHTISNFTYTTTDTDCIGLFGCVDDANAVIKNLILVAPDVNAAGYSWNVGCLVGYLRNGTIIACGIDGGSVTGFWQTGGLVGWNEHGTISNCYSITSVTGDYYIGGLVGHNQYGMIGNCYAAGSVTGASYTGGLVGSGGQMVNCFWDIETSCQSQSAGGTGKTTAQMKTASTFSGWAGCGGEGVWTIDEGQDYPRLSWQNLPGQPLPVQQLCDFLAGSGTAADPYLIYTAEQLNLIGAFSCEWDRHFLLANDINLSGFSGTEFNIIGTAYHPFTGVFDGNGHTISNFTYTTTAGADYIGLLGYVYGADAVIEDLTLVAPDVTVGYSSCVGSLVGSLGAGTITGCDIEGGSVSGDCFTGGLVGGNNEGTISNCYSSAGVTGDYHTGGLVGHNWYGTIENCYAAGSVSKFWGGSHTGGLVGSNYWYGTISNCYATGSVSGADYTGGLVGGNVLYGTISNCYATGNVSGTERTGGLLGRDDEGTVLDSFWDVNSSNMDTSAGGEPKTTAQMQTITTFTSAGWDFVDIWDICEGMNYPKLAWQMIMLGDFVCPDGVNLIDYSFFAGHWLDDNCADSADCEGADLDQSGTIDFSDLEIFADNWLEGVEQ